jgi:hypothetical protein
MTTNCYPNQNMAAIPVGLGYSQLKKTIDSLGRNSFDTLAVKKGGKKKKNTTEVPYFVKGKNCIDIV